MDTNRILTDNTVRVVPFTGGTVESDAEFTADSLPSPLREIVEHIRVRFRLTDVTSTLTALLPVVAATGPARSIQNPMDGSVIPLTLNLAFTSKRPSLALAGIRWALDPIFNSIAKRVGPDGRDEKALRAHHNDLHKRLEDLGVREFHSRQGHGGSDTRMAFVGDNPLNPTLLAQERKKLQTELYELARKMFPYILLENPDPAALVFPRQHSLDGHLISIFDQVGVTGLLMLRPKPAMELARLLAAAWSGRQFVRESGIHTTGISLIAVLHHDQARKLHQFDGGSIASSVFTVNADPTNIIENHALSDESMAEWIQVLNTNHRMRNEVEKVVHRLSSEAVVLFSEFADDCIDSDTPAAVADAAPLMALKITLGIHAGSREQTQIEVSAATTAAAVAITRALLTSAPVESPEASFEIELVVARLRVRGALSLRDLCRTFNNQRVDHVEPLLAKAIQAGVVKREGDKFALIS